MLFICIVVCEGKLVVYCRVFVDGVYCVLMYMFNVLEDDIFMVVIEYVVENFVFGCYYYDIECSDDFVMI